MGRGTILIALIFLALPLLLLVGALFIGAGLGMTLAALLLLITGFTVAIPLVDAR